jgi:hypothetical protein
MKRNEQLESIIELVEAVFEEEGYKTGRYSNTKIISTTEYDCLVLQDSKGKEFTIGFNESKIYDDRKGKWIRTNIVGGELEGAE